ncbi:MAG: response regulator transcription factor [Thermoleophilia bacterium]
MNNGRQEAQPAPIRVLLVDDHEILRKGLRALLSGQPGVDVVGEAGDGAEAVAKVAELRPDVVIMDIMMPRMNGIEATTHIHHDCPDSKVLILSMYDDEEYVQQVIRAGASGYVLKGFAADDLLRAIDEVHHGSSFLHPSVAAKLIDAFVRQVPAHEQASEHESGDHEHLTPRERQVLKLIAEGNTNQEVADQLLLSRKTVENHRTSIMRKLDAHDVTELVKYALRTGLISID